MWNRNKKKEQEAIDILYQQIGKIDDLNSPPDVTWKVKTAEFIKKFLGENSDQYKFITKISLTDVWKAEIPGKRAEARRFLVQCIQNIERIGLYEPPKINFLYRIDKLGLIGLFITIGGIIGGTAYQWGIYNSDIHNIELKQQVKAQQDSLNIYRNFINKMNARLQIAQKRKLNKAK